MEKLCNIKPVRMVLHIGPKPFDSEKKNVRLTGIEMQLAMACGTVEEVLNDDTTRILNEKNYNTPDEKTILDIDAYLKSIEEGNNGEENESGSTVTPLVTDIPSDEETEPDIDEDEVMG